MTSMRSGRCSTESASEIEVGCRMVPTNNDPPAPVRTGGSKFTTQGRSASEYEYSGTHRLLLTTSRGCFFVKRFLRRWRTDAPRPDFDASRRRVHEANGPQRLRLQRLSAAIRDRRQGEAQHQLRQRISALPEVPGRWSITLEITEGCAWSMESAVLDCAEAGPSGDTRIGPGRGGGNR